MALEECDKNPQSLPFLFLRSEDDEKMSFCSIEHIGDPINSVKLPDELRSKEFSNCYYDWIVLVDKDQQYSLWNPFTLEHKTFPRLDLTSEQEINDCILTSPPTSGDSNLILFEKNGPSLIYCNLGYNQQWKHYPIKEDFMQGCYLVCPLMCNGTIYALNSDKKQLVKIDPNLPDHLELVAPEFQWKSRGSHGALTQLVESGGELFCVILYFSRRFWFESKLEVTDVEITSLDFSTMELNKVESFKDRAFFMSHDAFSWPAIGSKVRGNHIYFTLSPDKSVYSLNMDDKTLSVFLLHPNFPNLKHQPIWIYTNSRDVDRYNKNHDLSRESEEKFGNNKLMRHSVIEDDVKGDFGKLPQDMLHEIGKRLILGDYISFRSCNKECQMACPRIQWTSADLEGFEDYARSIPPWLVYWQQGDDICYSLDLLCKGRYFISIPNNSQKDVSLCHSSSGWCVMLHGEKSIFLWNLVTKKIILLPDLTYGCEHVVGCTLSPNIDSIILIYKSDELCNIELVSLKKGEWHSSRFDLVNFEVGMENSLVYYDELICLLDLDGNMSVFNTSIEDEDEILELIYEVATPCSSYQQSFLMECDGNLMSIFVGDLGEWIRIFTTDYYDEIVWIEIENLENNTLYISRFACFSTTPATPEMRNRVYFSRFNCEDDNIVYYSLITKKLHVHGTEEVLKSFDKTKKHLCSSWVEVKWW